MPSAPPLSIPQWHTKTLKTLLTPHIPGIVNFGYGLVIIYPSWHFTHHNPPSGMEKTGGITCAEQ
jgi:hypothetical protein